MLALNKSTVESRFGNDVTGAGPRRPRCAPDNIESAEALCDAARTAWAGKRVDDAFALAWKALGSDRSRCSKRLLVELLRQHPRGLHAARAGEFLTLLTDPEVEPDLIAAAGWHVVLRSHSLTENAAESDVESLCAAFERDACVLALLREAPVTLAQAEVRLTRLRRWLLLRCGWRRFPALAQALTLQASLNGGAWAFDDEERSCLDETASAPLRSAYVPLRSAAHGNAEAADTIARAVTAQYESWPYPAWTRITRREPEILADALIKSNPDFAAALPIDGRILIVGCGTGREVADTALRFPRSAITAIDVSAASLDYARRKCSEYGIANVGFRQLDLHAVAELGERFHAIHCRGVLHHLSDPERGWRALIDVLDPSGFMDIMLYSRLAKLRLNGARDLFFADLRDQPVTDDLIRQARRRILDRLDHPLAAHVARSRDFSTLTGAHDQLLHRHDDPFDLGRIERILDELGLGILEFKIQSPVLAAAYEAMFPADSAHRDIASLMRFELTLKGGFFGNYRFICCRRGAGQPA